jgi:hypothetical protein
MARQQSPVISAQVVLTPASGKPAPADTPVTAATLALFAPSAATVAAAADAFRALGFEVGPMVGTSFSITAPVDTFERVFKVDLGYLRKPHAARDRSRGKTAGELELPASTLPETLKPLVQAVTFTPPPDFGPGNV